MLFEIEHVTAYAYSEAVTLGAHILRLRPRCDGAQRVVSFTCVIEPEPSVVSESLDLEGNLVTYAWFSGRTRALRIVSTLRAETLRTNPFDYVPETAFAGLPVAYPEDQAALLKPHRETSENGAEVAALADELAAAAHFEPLAFVWILNRYLHQKFEREIREEAGVQAPQLTLRRRRGASRDLAALFVAVCRQKGIACRFVSGYQARSEREGDQRFPHAWAEVYVSGGGWRGYDPSHGLAVADGHVAIAAACSLERTASIEGTYYGANAESRMKVDLTVRVY
jgi:transglutaminase-like putative cysteine protease